MRNSIYILFLFLGFHLCSNAQSKVETFTWLNAVDEAQLFEIEESSGRQDLTGLPVKVTLLPLPYEVVSDSISIELAVEKSLIESNDEIGFLSALNTEDLTLYTKNVVGIRGKYYLQLEFVPIIYDKIDASFYRIHKVNYEINVPAQQASLQLKSTYESPASSVLASGKWVKIKIEKSGVHKIPYSKLTSWGFSNPSKVNVFGNGGNLLPRPNASFRHSDLSENAVIHENGAIYFYAQGPVGWSYNDQRKMFLHQLHDYTDVAYYFLSDENGIGKRVEASGELSESYTDETSELDSYQFYELDEQNLLKSGIEWYGLRFDPYQSRTYSFNFENRVKSKEMKIMTNLIARSNPSSNFETLVDDFPIQKINIPSVDYGSTVGAFANEGYGVASFSTNSDQVDIELLYNSSSSSASGWLNYICVNAKELITLNQQLMFRNADMTGAGKATRYYIENTSSNSLLWDISDHTTPMEIDLVAYGGKTGFTYKSDMLKEFVVFNVNASLPEPEFEETVANQDLRGSDVPEMLIIAHPLFEDEAKRLANIHLQHSGLQCKVVLPYQVYNEFSSGSPDITAIRDYARFLYKKDSRFKYLLLFGDGSFDNRTYSEENTNFILTYQSNNSINIKDSYVSDDYYGFLDDNEGVNILFDKLDIGIGRFPVSNIEQAAAMVDKIEKYLNGSSTGPWKTEVTFLADDGDSNLHMTQADQLSQQVYGDFPSFNHNKIYFDAYPKITTSSGERYPDVNEAIKQQIGNGTLLFNYTGHGSERQLGHENVLDITTIKQFTNIDKLPVFVTATCEFSRYDNYHETSAGEWVVLSPLGGGVSMFTTTRIAWSNENFQINKSFYRNIFREDESGEKVRLGEVIQNTKNEIGSSVNKLNFTLLGDPALQLVYPNGDISTKSINGEEEPGEDAVIKALTQAEIEGEIEQSGTTASEVTIQVFDKPISVKTLGNKGAVPFEYQVYQNRIYKGTLDADNEHFLASFIVPKDIRYNVGKGRISYYSHNENGNEAFGADNTVLIGGVSDDQPDDTEGPVIELWLNDSTFMSGDITGSQPILVAKLNDESGINTSGVGIGHDITLVIDNARSLPINLNSFYTASKNSFTSGVVEYQLPQMAEGKHSLELKVWDNLNNSSLASIEFEVVLDGKLSVTNTKVYPNPVENGSSVWISFEHDAPNQILDVTYSLYSTTGRLIEQHQTTQAANGIGINPIEWMPGPLQKGMYILQCEIKSGENQTGKFTKKILVVR